MKASDIRLERVTKEEFESMGFPILNGDSIRYSFFPVIPDAYAKITEPYFGRSYLDLIKDLFNSTEYVKVSVVESDFSNYRSITDRISNQDSKNSSESHIKIITDRLKEKRNGLTYLEVEIGDDPTGVQENAVIRFAKVNGDIVCYEVSIPKKYADIFNIIPNWKNGIMHARMSPKP